MYGPVGGPVDVTLAPDPYATMTSPRYGRTYPSILLGFGTTVLHGGWLQENQDGVDAGLILQLIDVSTGTPVVGATSYVNMTTPTGQAYQDGYQMKAVKLDNTRALLTWQKEASGYVFAVVVSVVSGVISVGAPVQIGNNLTIQNPPGPEYYPSAIDVLRDSDLTPLGNSKASYLAQYRWFNVANDGTTWKEARGGCLISTSGTQITSFVWYCLDQGLQRFNGRTIADSIGSLNVGGKTLAFWSLFDQMATNNVGRTRATLVLVDWSTSPPTTKTKLVPLGDPATTNELYQGISTDGTYAVITDYPSNVKQIITLSNPTGVAWPVAPSLSPVAYVPTYGSFFAAVLQEPTKRGWLAGAIYGGQGGATPGSPPILLEATYKGAVLSHQSDVAYLNNTPMAGEEFYGFTAVPAGSRYAVALVDFEIQTSPYNYREVLYVYEPVRQGDIRPGGSASAFLQVRSGV